MEKYSSALHLVEMEVGTDGSALAGPWMRMRIRQNDADPTRTGSTTLVTSMWSVTPMLLLEQ